MPYNEQAIEYVTKTSILYEIMQRTNKCNVQWKKIDNTKWMISILENQVLWDLCLYKLSNGNSLEIVKNKSKLIAKFTSDDDDLFDVFFEEITGENKDINELIGVVRTFKSCSEDFDEIAGGGLKAGGKAIVEIPRYVRTGSGGLEIGGVAECSFAFTIFVGDVTEITTEFEDNSISILQPELNLYPWSDMAGIGSYYPPLASRVGCGSVTSTYIQLPLIPTYWFPEGLPAIRPFNYVTFRFDESKVNTILSHSRYQQKRTNGEDLCFFTAKITYKIDLNTDAYYVPEVLKSTIIDVDMLYGLAVSFGSTLVQAVPDGEYHTIKTGVAYHLPAPSELAESIPTLLEDLLIRVSVYNVSFEEATDPFEPIPFLNHNMVFTSVCLDVEFT